MLADPVFLMRDAIMSRKTLVALDAQGQELALESADSWTKIEHVLIGDEKFYKDAQSDMMSGRGNMKPYTVVTLLHAVFSRKLEYPQYVTQAMSYKLSNTLSYVDRRDFVSYIEGQQFSLGGKGDKAVTQVSDELTSTSDDKSSLTSSASTAVLKNSSKVSTDHSSKSSKDSALLGNLCS
jgi:hypothetical protein